MTAAKVDLKLNGGGRGIVLVDGEDISNLVTALWLERDESGTVTLTVSLVLGDLAATVDAARVQVDERSHAAMTALGWTPPPGGDA